MSTNDFDDRLDRELDFSATTADPGYGRSYGKLKEIVESLERKMNEDFQESRIEIIIEHGFLANIGQQLKVILLIPDKNYQDTLFRAYIPMGGMPVTLDLYGEEPEVCQKDAELETKILDFLGKIKDRMASYRGIAIG